MNLVHALTIAALLAPTLTIASSDPRPETPHRVLMVVTSHSQLGSTDEKTGLWLSEAAHPYYEFADHGFDVTFVSPEGGRPPIDPRSSTADDPTNDRFNADSVAQARFSNSLTPGAVDPADFDIIFFAGGHGTMWDFPDNSRLARLAATVYDSGGYVGAVCHGPAALVNVKLEDGTYLVAGRRVTGFTNEEETARGLEKVVPFLLQDRLTERGGDFVAGPNWQQNVVVSGHLVTGQNPASARGVAESIIELISTGSTVP